MKNIFKKIVGALLATSMIFTMSTAVCATEEGLYSTENRKAYGLEPSYEEIYTINDSQSSNYGITADVIHKNLLSLETSKVSEQKNFDGFKDDSIVEIYDIKVNYSTTENGNEVIKTTDDYRICDRMLISIPCDIPDLYVIYVNEGDKGSNISSKYVDGRYLFEVNFLGSFMLCSRFAHYEEVPKEYNMIEQTMVDPNTGITVSGVIPEGAMMYTTLENVHIDELGTLNERENELNLLKYDFPLPSIKEVFTKKTSDGKTKYDYSWYEEDFFADGSMAVDIVFVKDYQVVEFDSDLTVTIPFDYYKVLESKNFEPVEDFKSDYSEEYWAELERKASESHIAKAFQLNSTTSNLRELVVLTKEGGKDEFKFKTNKVGSGTFFIGNEILIENLVEVYGWSYDDLETFDDVEKVDDAVEATAVTTVETTSVTTDDASDISAEKDTGTNNILLIVCIATNVVWIVALVVFIAKKKKKKADK